eukprot:CAMPEP_0176419752 /NCGR_PEP_ID=MMETSP0127-20121128/8231_1 /TAXON_ID=938130 /ORGANISM="Platyophrya macrostoma, Strain WH" /LENGTH=743 /DNA_ID=CAMNT_0017800283 /DNA_START=1466 /DNA_END=3697 /DNA_ORIENTATION=-
MESKNKCEYDVDVKELHRNYPYAPDKKRLEELTAPITRVEGKDFKVLKDDGYLEPFKEHFFYRYRKYCEFLDNIEKNEGSLYEFSQGYRIYGFQTRSNGIYYREWAPGAKEVYLCGDFNKWNQKEFPLKKDSFGNWEIFFPVRSDGSHAIPHNTKVKLYMLNAKDEWVYKIPAWITYAVQDEGTKAYDGVYLSQEQKHKYEWKHPALKRPESVRIYETHVGMSSSDQKVSTYKEFKDNVLPRIKKAGYNVIQIMAIMEHAYYGSFGYHVTNFFAASSRYGTPNELKELIDTAHSMGIMVLIDLIHSHASASVLDGINMFDGTDYQYFHGGGKGKHELWDSQIFDYSKWEVNRFLLSNLAWWLEEYRFDGFRFDGITSLMYTHHGLGVGFSGDYREYFSMTTDIDGMVYLMLANTLIRRINPEAYSIAEDVSGMPALGRSVEEGGVGFDFRLQMAIPDKWIKLLKETKDDDWSMKDICWTLTNRRYDEKCVAYAESHDQAIVGDKTISMWLLDKDIYENMSLLAPESLRVSRGIALHKMIRLITCALGGESYLTFMGNEFGHPEWIDFPREGNGWSYQHCRRQWNLADDPLLYYHYLGNFDRAMMELEERYHWLSSREQYVTLQHEDDKIIVFERSCLLWIFNFHPTKSYEHYRIGTGYAYDHVAVLDTDEDQFAGKERLRHGHTNVFPIIKEPWCNRDNYIQVYIPARTAMVLRPLFPWDQEKTLEIAKKQHEEFEKRKAEKK